jgi:protein O-mannosyl-transferase
MKPVASSSISSQPLKPGSNRFSEWRTLWMSLLLALVTAAVFCPVGRCEFINYDDPLYVTENPHVLAGLNWSGLAWAFGHIHTETYWHPLSWLSHMADCQFFGLNPGAHHLVSLWFHALNTVLVFVVFQRLTGAFWRCAALAALFGLHPLQVDTVAWVTERKNLLSAFFGLLCLWAYARYAQCKTGSSGPSDGRENGSTAKSPPPNESTKMSAGAATALNAQAAEHSTFYYMLSLALLALGLMSKPVLVTWPFVMLLMDYWPLQHLQWKADILTLRVAARLLLEKLPFFVLAAASCIITVIAHHGMGILDTATQLPLAARFENALVSYARYLGKVVWPSKLAVLYPYPESWPLGMVIASGLFLVAIAGLVVIAGRGRPWLFVGWFWFAGVLVPFIGLVQAGAQAMADRFAYVPLIGLLVAVVWSMHALTAGWRYRGPALSLAALVAIALCAGLTRRQLGYWKDSVSLMEHTVAVTENNFIARNNLAVALFSQGRFEEAVHHAREALRVRPGYAEAHNNLGVGLGNQGRLEEAVVEFQEALRIWPKFSRAHYNLGGALERQGNRDQAIPEYQEAIRFKPDFVEARYSLALALALNGSLDGAVDQYRVVVTLAPLHVQAHYNLGVALANRGRWAEAIEQFHVTLVLKPGHAEARMNLASALAATGAMDEMVKLLRESVQLRPESAEARNNLGVALDNAVNVEEAISQYREAIRLQPAFAEAHNNLAGALAGQGRLDEAIEHYQQALRLRPDYPQARANLTRALTEKAVSKNSSK